MIVASKLRRVIHMANAEPGDYLIAENGVVLACPFCGQRMLCDHRVTSVDPLSLEPSVVGPGLNPYLKCCGHHFSITNGVITPHELP